MKSYRPRKSSRTEIPEAFIRKPTALNQSTFFNANSDFFILGSPVNADEGNPVGVSGDLMQEEPARTQLSPKSFTSGLLFS
ncbi:hypothetical protein Nepgr_019740 [Nepenthes gracilis]|uniref:Uncharacterized protein n=1 Tax=Nepenthes gracilis TaxID=150966 RepID=A0AAD3SWD7_NEPGR|nr:hypothetical protein Nepgr_019740 [Nepenthes gracilis]